MNGKRIPGMAPDAASLPEDKHIARGSMPDMPQEENSVEVSDKAPITKPKKLKKKVKKGIKLDKKKLKK